MSCRFLSPIILATLAGVAALPAAEPRTPETAVTPVLITRHSTFMKQIADAKGDFDFLLVGDSITDGWPSKSKETYAAFAPWKPLNLGISGERTEQVLWRLLNGELDGIHPKVAMVMIGTNNLGHAADEKPEWAAAGVAKIVETIRTKLPNTKILLLSIFPRSEKPTDGIRARVTATNDLIAKLHDGKMVIYKDITAAFLTPEGVLTKEVMPDGLHPNAKGYQIWLDAVKPTLDDLMK